MKVIVLVSALLGALAGGLLLPVAVATYGYVTDDRHKVECVTFFSNNKGAGCRDGGAPLMPFALAGLLLGTALGGVAGSRLIKDLEQ